MQFLRRPIIAATVLVIVVVTAGAVFYFWPSADSAFGIATGLSDADQSFTYGGSKIQLADAYADSYVTVVNLNGVPAGVVFGGTYLTDQFGNSYPQEDAQPSSTGDMALSYKPVTPLTRASGLRYTLNIERVSGTTVIGVSRASGVVLFNTAHAVAPPMSGSFGEGTVTFSEVRYGARVIAVSLAVQGVMVVGGYPPSEAAVKPRPRLEVRLAPIAGGIAKHMPYHPSVQGNITPVHAIAMLVDPGTYQLILSLDGVAAVQRTVAVE